MSTKTKKILVFLATVLLVIVLGSTIVMGITPSEITPEDPETEDIQGVGGKILGVIQTIGVVIAVVVLTVLGIKYMMGSAEEKAEYKKTMIPYVVGAVLIAAAPAIANMIYGLGTSIAGS